MIDLKDVMLKLLFEIMRNSRRSDRELARVLHISQPTVTRTRTRLEKEGMIEYSGVPNLAKLGYEIIAVIFGKRNHQKYPDILQKGRLHSLPADEFHSNRSGFRITLMTISVPRKIMMEMNY